jgi:hypothetical protein
MLPALLLMLACTSSDPLERLEACPDQSCQTQAFLPAWQADPEGATRWLVSLEDATVQATMVEALALEQPDAAAELCRALPQGGHARARCERRVVRPHLAGGGKFASTPGEGKADAAPGPRSSALPLLELEPPPWLEGARDEVQATLEGCEAEDPRLCARLAAREHGRQGRWEQAGAACLAGDPGLGREYHECLFQSAEAMAEAMGAEGLGQALRLCSWSDYGPMCVAHCLTLVGPELPPADNIGPEEIEASLAVVAAIRAVSEGQLELQANWIDRYWASWTFTALWNSDGVGGRFLEQLPPEAAHHVPIAAASRMLRQRDPSGLELEALVQELSALLARAPGPARTGQAPPARRLMTNLRRQTWPNDRAGEHRIPSAWAMGPARRARAEDPQVDLRIAIMEAAAQLPDPPPASFFLAPVGDEDQHPLLRWTGARIGAALDPPAAAALVDPDPLVQETLYDPRPLDKGPAAKRRPPPSR